MRSGFYSCVCFPLCAPALRDEAGSRLGAASCRASSGFSLVELSIVLVILGLLTGGILSGQSLIRAAELRSVTTEFQTYQTAVMTFRDRYFALPGDMPNATSFWGVAGGSGADSTCYAVASFDAKTCNGNADGMIGGTSTTRHERFRAWQQMASASLISGSYTGNAGSAGNMHAHVGINIPRSKLSKAGWNLLSDNTGGPTKLQIGAELTTNSSAWAAILAPEEAWNIDVKVDDGIRTTGLAIGDGGGCESPTDVAQYNIQNSAILCGMTFAKSY